MGAIITTHSKESDQRICITKDPGKARFASSTQHPLDRNELSSRLRWDRAHRGVRSPKCSWWFLKPPNSSSYTRYELEIVKSALQVIPISNSADKPWPSDRLQTSRTWRALKSTYGREDDKAWYLAQLISGLRVIKLVCLTLKQRNSIPCHGLNLYIVLCKARVRVFKRTKYGRFVQRICHYASTQRVSRKYVSTVVLRKSMHMWNAYGEFVKSR